MIPLGEIAALTTALLWSGCAQFFGAAGARIGSVAVNHIRLPAALLLLTLGHVVVHGQAIPIDISPRDTWLFVISGVVGLVLGDACGFQALVLLGPPVVTLIFTLVPAIATIEAAMFLGEPIALRSGVGIAITIAGIALALWSRTRTLRDAGIATGLLPRRRPGVMGLGLLLAVGGAAGQATGVVLAKPALAASDALSGTWVRMLAATLAIWGYTGVRAAWSRGMPAWWAGTWGDRRAHWLVLGGVLTGPTVGVWLSLVATKHSNVAIATTLMSLTPIFVLLAEWPLTGRRPRALELMGALTAIAGIAMLVAV